MPLDWSQEKASWPHSEKSVFISCNGVRWHVQRFGFPPNVDADALPPLKPQPIILLLHGTGASSHSWRDVAQALATTHPVVTLDLPGHGFTNHPGVSCMSLPGMASAIAQLLVQENWQVHTIAGHSAGAAIAIEMCISNLSKPEKLVSFNGALLPLQSLSGQLFSPIAKLLVRNSLVPKFFSWRAENPKFVSLLMNSTGSTLTPEGTALYGRLVRNADHAAGALAMMANWDLESFSRKLYQLKIPLRLIAAQNDKTISPRMAMRVKSMLPNAELIAVANLGHLSHEEKPLEAAALILRKLP